MRISTVKSVILVERIVPLKENYSKEATQNTKLISRLYCQLHKMKKTSRNYSNSNGSKTNLSPLAKSLAELAALPLEGDLFDSGLTLRCR